jgi:hypothetical protein
MAIPADGTKHFTPGHGLLLYGKVQTVESVAKLIRGSGTNYVPNLRHIQKRYTWRQFQPVAFGPLNGPACDELLEDLATCKAYDVRLRMLLMIKALLGGKAVPDNLRTAAYDGGVWKWGLNPDGSYKNEHPRLYNDGVRDALWDFVTKLCAFVDSYGRPGTDVRHWLEDIAFNETSWGSGWEPASWTAADKTANLRKVGLAMRGCHTIMRDNLKNHFVTHFVNFPNNAVFSILKDTVAGLPAHMLEVGSAMGGPDSWMDDLDAERGSFLYYPNADGITPVCVSVQNANFMHYNHKDQSSGTFRYDITIQQLYDHTTTQGTWFKEKFKAGLRATHVVWAAMDTPIPGSSPSIVPLTKLKNFMLNKWETPGPDYHNVAPGVITATPLRMQSSAAPSPIKLTPSLAADTGIIGNDGVTKNAAINLAGLQTGATKQWALADTGPWTNGDYAPVQGVNTVYFRQVSGGVPGPVSDPFTFTFRNQPPELIRLSINGNLLFLNYFGPLALTNELTHRPDKAAYKLEVQQPDLSWAVVPIQGIYIAEPLKYIRLELSEANAVTAGKNVRLSYTMPATGDARAQDIAGNYLPSFTNLAVNNTTGVPAPTNTPLITSVAGVTVNGGSTQQLSPVTIVGTIPAALSATEQIEVQRGVGTQGFATVTGTNWTFTANDETDGGRTFRARIRNGDLVGPWSVAFAVTFDTKEPTPPSCPDMVLREGDVAILRGVWGTDIDKEVLEVYVNGTKYTTANGLVAPAGSWTLNLGVLPVGQYALYARVVDFAGNESLSDNAMLTVEEGGSINHLRLSIAARRPYSA